MKVHKKRLEIKAVTQEFDYYHLLANLNVHTFSKNIEYHVPVKLIGASENHSGILRSHNGLEKLNTPLYSKQW